MAGVTWESNCQVGAEYRDIPEHGGLDGARKCAEKLMRETGEPHFVDQTSVDDGEGHLWPFYFVVSNSARGCGNGTEYNNPLEGNNENYAQECANALNFLNKLEGRAERYTIRLARSLPLLADSFKVVVDRMTASK